MDPSADRSQPGETFSRVPLSRRGGCALSGGVLLWLLIAVASAAGGTAQDAYPAASRIEWMSFEPALFSRARAENRTLFLYFHGQWCSWCHDFQAQSLEQDKVVQVLRAGYIPVLIDLDRRRDLFTRYGGRGLPFVVLLDARDRIIGRFTGHLAPADLVRVLTERRRQVSATGRELAPSEEPIHTVAAFLAMLDQLYDPDTRRFSGSGMFGTLSKRPQPWTLSFLLTQESWRARMPGLLDQVVADLYDRVDGGFFFFHDPDQPVAARARETSKRLDQNAAFLWLFSDAYARLGEERYRRILERSLGYLEAHLWDSEQQRFFSSQYSDNAYYAQPPSARGALPAPAVDRSTYADASGQAIAALVRASQALRDPRLLEWAGAALAGLDRHLRSGDGYLHALPGDGPPELKGYLPAQVWPGIAWHLYRNASGVAPRERDQALLRYIATFYDSGRDAYRERNTEELEPWIETRTQAALAWWLAQLRPADIESAGIDAKRVHAKLIIQPGADPDDAALGFWALIGAGPDSVPTRASRLPRGDDAAGVAGREPEE